MRPRASAAPAAAPLLGAERDDPVAQVGSGPTGQVVVAAARYNRPSLQRVRDVRRRQRVAPVPTRHAGLKRGHWRPRAHCGCSPSPASPRRDASAPARRDGFDPGGHRAVRSRGDRRPAQIHDGHESHGHGVAGNAPRARTTTYGESSHSGSPARRRHGSGSFGNSRPGSFPCPLCALTLSHRAPAPTTTRYEPASSATTQPYGRPPVTWLASCTAACAREPPTTRSKPGGHHTKHDQEVAA